MWVDQPPPPPPPWAGAWLREGERDELKMGGQQMVLFMRKASDIKGCSRRERDLGKGLCTYFNRKMKKSAFYMLIMSVLL